MLYTDVASAGRSDCTTAVALGAPRLFPVGFYRSFGKSVVDIAFVLLVAPIALPMIAVAVVVLLMQGVQPFYRQARVGRDGRIFQMLKLRTMVPDADRKLAAYLAEHPAARAEWEHKQKLMNDPRVTRLGRLLRKTSMDELPQLWNVLCGDMSIVGPRPMMPEQQSMYPGVAYYRMRPGITGYWQVSDRNRTSFARRADHDTAYFENISFLTDAAVLVRTAVVVVRGTGW